MTCSWYPCCVAVCFVHAAAKRSRTASTLPNIPRCAWPPCSFSFQKSTSATVKTCMSCFFVVVEKENKHKCLSRTAKLPPVTMRNKSGHPERKRTHANRRRQRKSGVNGEDLEQAVYELSAHNLAGTRTALSQSKKACSGAHCEHHTSLCCSSSDGSMILNIRGRVQTPGLGLERDPTESLLRWSDEERPESGCPVWINGQSDDDNGL